MSRRALCVTVASGSLLLLISLQARRQPAAVRPGSGRMSRDVAAVPAARPFTELASQPGGRGGVDTPSGAAVTPLLARGIVGLFHRPANTRIASASLVDLSLWLRDESLPREYRLQVARRLASEMGEEGWLALQDALNRGDSLLRTLVAEALGKSSHAGALNTIVSLLQDVDPEVRRGAIRALGNRNEPESVAILAGFLDARADSPVVVQETIRSLGQSSAPESQSVLENFIWEASDPELVRSALESMAGHPFEQTRPFLQAYLGTPGTEPELRSAALGTLENSSDAVSDFAAQYLADADADVRATAAWVIATADDRVNVTPAVASRLAVETDPDVRARLYQALRQPREIDLPKLLPGILAESDEATRAAGLDLWADQLRFGHGTDLPANFDQVAIPELRETALAAPSLSQRLQAVISLDRARTAGARQALQTIIATSSDSRVVVAAQTAMKR